MVFAQGAWAQQPNGPVTITSERLELDHQAQKVIFSGKVHAVQDDVIIDCREMEVLYDPSAVEGEFGPESIREILAMGGVVISQGERRVTGEKARYLHGERKIVVTGDPVFKEGPQNVQGARIVFFLDTRRFVVEGSDTRPVKAVLFPERSR